MSKHRLSSVPLPPPKRAHFEGRTRAKSLSPITFDSSLYDELILVIFSHLSWTDLCAIQPTSRKWSRLTADNQLWKELYLKEYGRSRLRGARGFVARSDGREMKALPGTRKISVDPTKDWKWMFRISSNWRTGRCTTEQLKNERPPECSQIAQSTSPRQSHILLVGNLIITASSEVSTSPSIILYSPNYPTHTLPLAPGSIPRGPARVITIALDQLPPASGNAVRLASFLSSGEFFVHNVNHTSPSRSSRLFTYIPPSKTPRTCPIIQAVYHHPLLITLSKAFQLSLYDLSLESVTHTQTLTSFTSFPPTSLVLSTPAPNSYKLVLAYAIPVYPAHWSVGAAEIIIAGPQSNSAHLESDSSSLKIERAEHMKVISSRIARAIDIPSGWIDEVKLRQMREQWGRKVTIVADTQTDGKWVVLAPGEYGGEAYVQGSPSQSSDSDTDQSMTRSTSSYTGSASMLHSWQNMQLYRVSFPSSAHSSASPKLTFVRSLHGQTGPVSAMAVSDGRCVTLSMNGSMWVWDLEAGTGAEVEGASEDVVGMGVAGSVVFNEKRIVSMDEGGIVVRRFDV